MLVNDFYTIREKETGAGFVKATIDFDKDHAIFTGHFPSTPIVPGVCMIQIVREFLEQAESQKLRISSGENIKFLSIINPKERSTVKVDISYSQNDSLYAVQACLFTDTVTYFKFKGSFQVL
jgi:3-hydroxyacyl-[acyl-carrier-protein] dehydratase